MTVRTRVAPSPTGDPHVGTAYVALFNYCLAKANGGEFILRIEDTDQVRSSRESEEMILKSLRWAGIEWDEGPDVGGPHGPYRQSERSELYQKYAQQLLDDGHAFRCFLTPDEVAELRREHQAAGALTAMANPYALITKEESDALAASGKEHVVRMRVPREGTCIVNDRLRGQIEIAWDQVDMQILLKSDGLPTYHLANVVDDHHMQITHVLRGEEWISSAPKHLLLYQYLGWEAPVLCHLPLLRNPDRSKLSKRKNPTSITYYERMGYLPEALLNYLGRMAWSMPDEREKFDLSTMVEHFDLDRVSLGGPIFDVSKLNWLNGTWIREDLDDEAFADRVTQWALNRTYLDPVIPLVRQRIDKWSDLVSVGGFFLDGLIDLTPETLVTKGLEPDEVRRVLCYSLWAIDTVAVWESDGINLILRETAAVMDLKLRVFLAPLFIAISGRTNSTPLFNTMAILGRDMSRARIRHALNTIKPMSGKEQGRWRKAYDKAITDYATRSATEN
jgi:glutamyl-tRNA synthetase